MATALFAPDGTVRDIPDDQLQAAIGAGGVRAVKMRDPQGAQRYVPLTSVQDAVRAGGHIDESTETPKEGFWKSLGQDLGGLAKGALPLLAGPPGLAYGGIKQGIQDFQSIKETGKTLAQRAYADRVASGRAPAYAAAAGVNEALGVNAKGMEQAADSGDVGGVLGHAAAVPAAMGITAGVAKAVPLVGKAVGVTGDNAARMVVNDTLRPLPKMMRFGKDPVGFVVDNGITANSLEELHAKINDTLQQKISDLNGTLAQSQAKIDLRPTAQFLQDQIQRATLQRNVPLANQLRSFLQERFGNGQRLDVSPTIAAEIKRGIQDSINWNADSPGMSAVKKQLQYKLGQDIHSAVPGSAMLDDAVSSGIEASKAAERQMLQSQTANGRTAIVRPGALGAAAGAVTGNPIVGAGMGIIAENVRRQPMLSTRFAKVASGAGRVGKGLSTADIPATPAAAAALGRRRLDDQ